MNLRTRTAALTLAVPLGLGLLVGCGDDDTEPTSSGTASDPGGATSAPSSPSTPSSAEPSSATPTESGSGTVAAPVYFTGETPMGLRLYREFRQVEGDNPLEEAAALLVAGDALDPDYGTLLQGVTISSVSQEDGAIVVTLGEDSPLTAGKGTSAQEARLAVQSLVYTLQGTAQTRDPVRVRLADGSPADLFGQPTGEGVEAAPELQVLSLVSLTTPQEGATASGTLDVEGVAASFEATVPYAVLDSTGREVLSDSTMAEQFGDRLYPFSVQVDISALPPGTYTLVARTDDPSGGEGPGAFEDTRTFTVD
ncbi:Gmad2 immunoglobulin-like domain-containing protein [Nocardioides rubriscoriae]|uniref:Gmad2 immunoglobulin-like domain-containing protein n=1 Tax=Nocardioides rubriscoriae TaxID=642762 RepID=UPI0014788CCA|nr:Gmad2 immunoglobulin-like domain-containing protein [Nocardioides rubriscoriae]